MKTLLLATVFALTSFGSCYAAGPHTEASGEPDAAAINAIEPASTTPRFSPSGGPSDLTLGQLIAYRIKDPDLSDFKKAMQAANITGRFDPEASYTVFAPVNGEFDATAHPMDYYIINQGLSLEAFPGKYDTADNIKGDAISLNRTGNKSFYIDDMRVNEVNRNPEGIVYKVGGMSDAPHL